MSTPNQLSDTPRTDAAWAKTFQDDEDQCRAGNAATDMRDECATLERELAALAAERDQLRAQLHALNLVCGTTDADKFQTWVDRANARAERAEAELAAERARMADLVADLNDACITLESAKNDCDDYAMQNTAFKLMAVSNVLLQYIPNAAMKGGAK